MKKFRLCLLLILFFICGCKISNEKEEILGIEFSKEPLQTYTTTDKLDDILKNIEISIKTKSSTTKKMITDDDVTVTGFDLTRPGYHTLKVKYEDKTIEWNYLVKLPAWDGTASTSWYNNESTTFKIKNANELAGLAKLVNEGNDFNGKVILLENDIDLANLPWTPISVLSKGTTGIIKNPFSGTFDAQNHTIENLTILASHKKTGEHILSAESYYHCGLFGYVKDATIKNVIIKNVNIMNGMMNNYVRSTQGTGALAGWVSGTSTITNIKITGNIVIKAEYKVGGVIGNISGSRSTISNIFVLGDASSMVYGSDTEFKDTNNFGGIIGYSDATDYTIDTCVTNIKVSGYTSGGIIGCVNGKNTLINNCAVYGEIIEPEGSITGGISGARFMDFTVTNCYVLGNVSYGNLKENVYADVIVSRYGNNRIVTSKNIYYASDKISKNITNTLEAKEMKYSEIIAILPDELKID